MKGQLSPYVIRVPNSERVHTHNNNNDILFYDQPFRVTGHFETSAQIEPKVTLKTTWPKLPIFSSA